MAGIGVKLNRIYRKNTITTNLVGFFYSTVVTIAPLLVVIANLAPAKLCGVESNGMVLASGEETVRVLFLDPETPLGERVR